MADIREHPLAIVSEAFNVLITYETPNTSQINFWTAGILVPPPMISTSV